MATDLSQDVITKEEHEAHGLSDTQLRYLGYFGRLGRLVKSVSRYLAYTSDIGEAFRPIVPPSMVKAAYAISWLYVGTDVSITGYQESKQPGATGKDIAQVCIKRGVFQSMASMLLPAATIHTTVAMTSSAFKKAAIKTKWGPTIAGLAVVPALPYLFDEPVEHAVEYIFTKYLGFKPDRHLAAHGHHEEIKME